MATPTLIKPKKSGQNTWKYILQEVTIEYVKNLDNPKAKFKVNDFFKSNEKKLVNGSSRLKLANLYGAFRELAKQNIVLQDPTFKSGEYKLNPALLEDIYPANNSTIHNDQLSVDQSHPLNIILYGPPGTGKTYITKQKAVEIIFPNHEWRGEDLNKIYNALTIGQYITFTTFHQSMGYEEFVEGLKPKLNQEQVAYEVKDGILKEIVRRTKQSEKNADNAKAWENVREILYSSSHTWLNKINDYERLKKVVKDNNEVEISQLRKINIFDSNSSLAEILQEERPSKKKNPKSGLSDNIDSAQLLLFTPDNQRVTDIGIVETSTDAFRNTEILQNETSQVTWLLNDINVPLELFRLDKEMQPVVEAVKSNMVNNLIDAYIQVLKNDHTTLNHVLIIDEINRGNVSAIFGELITLLEDSKREGQPDALSVKLPYSGEDFILPSNLYIIGTMNTADRSVEAIDTALRRRFVFEEMLPDISKLETDIDGINVQALLTAINDRLTALKDKNHTIGHAYFMNCKTAVDVLHVLCFKVLPLLEEYFYGQQELIEVVLSSEFFVENKFEFAGDRKKLIEGLNLGESARKKTLKSGPAIYEKLRENDSEIAKLVNSITID